MAPKTLGSRLIRVLYSLSSLYLTVIRGTPCALQLMIWWFVVFVNAKSKILVACLAFGLNSAAYVSEIFRGGILSVDSGQMEAGRSLGLSYLKTMRFIILPQALKASLPSLGNEVITLLKETSVCGFIALNDLTRAANQIQGITYQAFFPLIGAAAIYLGLVMLLSKAFSTMEGRMRESDQRQTAS